MNKTIYIILVIFYIKEEVNMIKQKYIQKNYLKLILNIGTICI
jgi:hypothetical protein